MNIQSTPTGVARRIGRVVTAHRRSANILTSLDFQVSIWNASPLPSSSRIHITLYEHTTDLEALDALVIGCLCQHLLVNYASHFPSPPTRWDVMKQAVNYYQQNTLNTKYFIEELQKKWVVDMFILETKRARIKVDN